ncbi:MAG: TIGR01777 family oxidoreductase [Fibrobacteres bacterium]|jgi:uncharacterized protein (TIGR01777 family)|nr:TIGR01777 family oxidoreductase [Fibrobacterota bacterium]
MIVLLTGATGFIGRAVAGRLAGQGHTLRALTRNPQVNQEPRPQASRPLAPLSRAPSSQPPFPPGCRLFPWREGDPVPSEALEGADAVVHLAGESLAAGRWTAARKERIRSSRVDGTRALVDAIGRMAVKPKVFAAASAVGYYGDSGNGHVDENSPAGEGFLAGICRAWEAEAFRAEALGVRTVALRLGIVLGKGGVLAKLAPLYRLGAGATLGNGRQWWSWIHLEDAAGLFAHALASENLRGPLNAVAGSVPQREFARALGRAVHRPVLFRAPAFALRLALGELAASLLEGQRATAEKALRSGYLFRYPGLGQALSAAIAPEGGPGS